MCLQKIELTFTNLKGAQGRMIAHTCGPIIEIPAAYESYCEFKNNFFDILKTGYSSMHIVRKNAQLQGVNMQIKKLLKNEHYVFAKYP